MYVDLWLNEMQTQHNQIRSAAEQKKLATGLETCIFDSIHNTSKPCSRRKSCTCLRGCSQETCAFKEDHLLPADKRESFCCGERCCARYCEHRYCSPCPTRHPTSPPPYHGYHSNTQEAVSNQSSTSATSLEQEGLEGQGDAVRGWG